MKYKRKKCRTLLILALAIAMICSAGISVFAINDGDTVNYTHRYTSHASEFTVDGGYDGACAQYGVDAASSGSATATKIANSSRIAKLVYKYGIQEGWSKNHDNYKPSWSFTKHQMLTSLTQVSEMGFNSWKTAFLNDGGGQATVNEIEDLWNSGDNLPDAPNGFELFTCNAGSNQHFMIWRYSPAGKVTLKKTANRSPKNGQGATLAGAVYYVYTDASCTTRAKDTSGNDISFTTDASGNTAVVEVEQGTYYAKEITASPGFSLDSQVRSVSVTASNDASNPAVFNSVEILKTGYVKVKKVSGNTDITG